MLLGSENKKPEIYQSNIDKVSFSHMGLKQLKVPDFNQIYLPHPKLKINSNLKFLLL